jgi:hypothetical protein
MVPVIQLDAHKQEETLQLRNKDVVITLSTLFITILSKIISIKLVQGDWFLYFLFFTVSNLSLPEMMDRMITAKNLSILLLSWAK